MRTQRREWIPPACQVRQSLEPGGCEGARESGRNQNSWRKEKVKRDSVDLKDIVYDVDFDWVLWLQMFGFAFESLLLQCEGRVWEVDFRGLTLEVMVRCIKMDETASGQRKEAKSIIFSGHQPLQNNPEDGVCGSQGSKGSPEGSTMYYFIMTITV